MSEKQLRYFLVDIVSHLLVRQRVLVRLSNQARQRLPIGLSLVLRNQSAHNQSVRTLLYYSRHPLLRFFACRTSSLSLIQVCLSPQITPNFHLKHRPTCFTSPDLCGLSTPVDVHTDSLSSIVLNSSSPTIGIVLWPSSQQAKSGNFGAISGVNHRSYSGIFLVSMLEKEVRIHLMRSRVGVQGSNLFSLNVGMRRHTEPT